MRPSRTLFPLLASALLLATWSASAAPPECAPRNEVALRKQVAMLVTSLRVANYRADAALMAQKSEELEALMSSPSCPETMRLRLCDADCHYQRASVFLFRATGLLYFSSKNSASSEVTAPKQLFEAARQGITIVEQGLGRLPRQQTGGDAGKVENLPFNRYLKASARLSTLKARLLMAQGDIWYRQASVSRVENLNFLVNKALGGEASQAGLQKGNEHSKAMAHYDEAFWFLMETRGALPEDALLFASELSELASAEQDITLRLQSIRKGFLYLNIDPDHFTTQSIDALGRKLKQLQIDLDGTESTLETLTKEWKDKYANLQKEKFDADSAAHARSIDAEVFRLQQVQTTAGQLKLDLQKKIDVLNNGLSKFELQQRIRDAEADLRRRSLELNNQLTFIQSQKELDLLTFRKDDVRDDMSNIQFNIDMTLAAFNFEMQLDGLKLQLEELKNRITLDGDTIGILNNRKQQLQRRMDLEDQRATAAGILINRIRQAQATAFKSARVPIVQRICAVDAQLAFYNNSAQGFSDPISGVSCSSPASGSDSKQELNTQICKAREELHGKDLEQLKAIRDCISGGSCPAGGESIKATVEKASEANMQIFKAQKAGFGEVKKLLEKEQQKLKQVREHFTRIRTGTKVADAALLASQIQESAAESKMGFVGPFPIAEMSSPIQKVAQVVRFGAELTVQQLQREFEDVQFKQQIGDVEHQIDIHLAELAKDIAVADKQELFELAMKNRAISEIHLDLARLDRERNQLLSETVIQTFECKEREGDINATIARLQAERDSLVAELQAQTDETALTSFDIELQQNIQAQAQTEKARLELDREGVELEISKVRTNQTNLIDMRKTVERQQEKVTGFKEQVGALKNDFTARNAVLQELKKKIENLTGTMKESEKTFILTALDDARKAASSQISGLEEALKKVEGTQELQEQLHAVEDQLLASVKESQEKLIGMVAQAPTSTAEAIFWDFENLQAELARGAPELIDAKQRLLQDINFTYNLYRNRYNMLTRFTPDVSALSADKTFVQNKGDVDRLLRNCATLDSGGGCQPGSLMWSEHTMTGSVSEFTLDKNSGLIQQLLSDGRARFELSPFAVSEADSRNLGRFVLWDQDSMDAGKELLLINVVAEAEKSPCRNQNLLLRHLGIGATFSTLSANSKEVIPSLVVKRPVESTVPIYGDGERERLTSQEYDKFRQGSYTAQDLENRLHADFNRYKFVGYPLVATYELIADRNLVACLNKGNGSLKLGFIFIEK